MTGAEMMKIASILFFNYLIENDLLFKVLMVNLIHDEILIESPKELAEECSIKLKECMEKAGTFFCDIIPVKATPVITPYWTH